MKASVAIGINFWRFDRAVNLERPYCWNKLVNVLHGVKKVSFEKTIQLGRVVKLVNINYKGGVKNVRLRNVDL